MMAVAPGNLEVESSNRARSAPPTPAARPDAVRRRGSLQQGFALEALGHAVEYLIDSRMFATTTDDARTDQEAIQLLMRLSRAVFQECPEVEPFSRKCRRWMAHGWSRGRQALDWNVPGQP